MNQKKTPEERKQILIQLIKHIKKNTRYKSLVEIGKKIEVSPSALSNWQDGKNDPYKIPSYNLWKLLELRKWSLDRFILYLEGEISYRELTEVEPNITKAAINLPYHERFRHAIRTMESLENEFTATSAPQFTRVLNQWFESQNISLQEAARITKILPPRRFQALLSGIRPIQRELINLAICESFVRPDGSKYDLSDLELLVNGNFDG